jgi:hypothetical protein
MAGEHRRTHELLPRLQLLFLRRFVPNQYSTLSLPRFGRWVTNCGISVRDMLYLKSDTEYEGRGCSWLKRCNDQLSINNFESS